MTAVISGISNPEHKERVRRAVEEAVKLQYQAEAIRFQVKDIADMLKQEFEIPPSEFNSVVRTIVKANLSEQIDKVNALEDAIQALGIKTY